MSLLVVDTDVVSYIFKDHPTGEAYREILKGQELVLSFMTLAELRLGARKAEWGPRKLELLGQYLSRFAICFPDERLCDLWGEVVLTAMRQGNAIDAQDAWVAATALYLGVPLVSHNARHFRRVAGLQLLTR